jgi:hypothetical protein
MPWIVMPLKMMSSEKFRETGLEVRPSREMRPPGRYIVRALLEPSSRAAK